MRCPETKYHSALVSVCRTGAGSEGEIPAVLPALRHSDSVLNAGLEVQHQAEQGGIGVRPKEGTGWEVAPGNPVGGPGPWLSTTGHGEPNGGEDTWQPGKPARLSLPVTPARLGCCISGGCVSNEVVTVRPTCLLWVTDSCQVPKGHVREKETNGEEERAWSQGWS